MTHPGHIASHTVAVCAVLILAGCAQPTQPVDEPQPETRPFYLGFTPWPYRSDSDYMEIVYTYDLVQEYGDIVTHHFQQGIPYPEAYAMRSDPQATGLPGYDAGSGNHSLVYAEVDLRIGQTDAGGRVYLAIDCVDSLRKNLVGYYGDDWDSDGSTEQQPRPAPWDTASFSEQRVADAYVSYARAVIDAFSDAGLEVAYFNYASEISDLLLNDPDEFDDFLVFADRVHSQLEAAYPSLPLMISVAAKHPHSSETAEIRSRMDDLTDDIDVLGVSVYPYAFFQPAIEDPDDLPTDWLSAVADMAPNTPVAVTETGWIAEDLSIPAFPLQRSASEDRQAAYADTLLREAARLDAEFVVWFSLIDYSYFWDNTLGRDDLSAIWRDTGLLDYDGVTDLAAGTDLTSVSIHAAGLSEREAAGVWGDWLALPHD